MAQTREELIYMARLAEQTERFEDMINVMKKVVMLKEDGKNVELTIDERNLLSVAYKNQVGSRRTAWRAISSIESKEESKGEKGTKNLKFLRDYKTKIEEELSLTTKDVLDLLDQYLIEGSSKPEAKVFYLKMKGDYHRYVAEYASGDVHSQASESAKESYERASDIAKDNLSTTHPIRLGLALNFSVFYYEVLNNPAQACTLAKNAFDDAIAEIESIAEDQYKDSTTIMQLIRDNLTLWTSEMNEDPEGGDDDKKE